MYSNPDDLDSQPEFPLRDKMVYYKEVEESLPDLEVLEGDIHPAQIGMSASSTTTSTQPSNFPSATLLLLLWIIGLALWFYFMVLTNKSVGSKRRKGGLNSNKNK